MPNIINCTPHPITIIRKDGSTLTLSKGTLVPRLANQETKISEIDGIEIYQTEYGKSFDMPPIVNNNYYIVSRMIVDANKDRKDLLAPATLVRDSSGNIIGSKGLSI